MGKLAYKRGFSLIEVIIIIAIIGVLVSIAAPNFLEYMPRSRLNGAARTLAGNIMTARMEAVKLNQSVYLQYADNHQYKIVKSADILKSVDLHTDYHDVTITEDFGKIIFNSRGTADGPHTISLTNPSGSKSIDVTITGRVKIN